MDVEIRKHLLYLNRDILGLKEIERYLEMYNEDELIRLFKKGQRRKIKNTEANELLLGFFIDKVIRRYDLDNEQEYFIASGMKKVVYGKLIIQSFNMLMPLRGLSFLEPF